MIRNVMIFLLGLVMLVPAASFAANEPRQSLFFSPNQIASIMRANQGFIAPKEAYDEKNQSEKPVDSGPRILSLSGIMFQGPNDWIIWFNGHRVTPKNIPDRVMGLKVESNRIHLKWMDIGNQRVINLTLYPHQQYNIDTNVILPGT